MEKNKKDKKDKRQHDIEAAKKEIEDMIKQAEEQLGVDRDQIKVVKIKLPGNTLKWILFDALMTIILNTILILSLSGYIKWTKNDTIIPLLVFALTYTLIELTLKNILNRFFVKLIIKTFGLITLLPSILAIPLVFIFADYMSVTSVTSLLLMFVGVIFIRSVFRTVLNRYRKG